MLNSIEALGKILTKISTKEISSELLSFQSLCCQKNYILLTIKSNVNIGPLGKILTKISTKKISSEIYPKFYLKYFSEIS